MRGAGAAPLPPLRGVGRRPPEMSPEDEEAAMRATLAARGYDMVDAPASDSDDDEFLRLKKLSPQQAKELGNKAFGKGKYDKAIKAYQGGLKTILSALCAGPEAMSDMTLSELDLTLNLNIAMCHTKKGEFLFAERSVEKSLARRDALPPHLIVKALYRKANAQRSMTKLPECIATLEDLLSVESDNAAALQMKQEVEREHNRQCRAQKANMKKMFAVFEGENKKEAEARRAQRSAARASSGVRWGSDDIDTDAFERGEVPCSEGRDWGRALNCTVLWAIEELAVEGCACLREGTDKVSLWFLGVSSTCELRWLKPSVLLEKLPSVAEIEIVLIGFLGELDPDNKRVPDPKGDSLPPGLLEAKAEDGTRRATVRLLKGTLEEVLASWPWPDRAVSLEEAARAAGVEEAETVAADGATVATPGAETAEAETAAEPVVEAAAAGAAEAAGVAAAECPPPDFCFVAHPQLHRYYSEFFPAITWLINRSVPTILVGASEPDPSWKQDEILLRSLGVEIVLGKRESPYPMCLPDNPKVRKCSHIIGFRGGKPLDKDKLVKTKIDLLAQDYTVR